ncbi:YnfU family zinc-binding protein [Klebsiella michiganensis]
MSRCGRGNCRLIRQSTHSLSRIKNDITLICPYCGNIFLPSESKPVK